MPLMKLIVCVKIETTSLYVCATCHDIMPFCPIRNELCCKAGIELALIFKKGHEHYE